MSGSSIRPHSELITGLLGRCPRCAEGQLFNRFIGLRARCSACGLDFSFADPGDGPAVFVMFIAGFVVVGSAAVVEIAYQPPFWLHALLWAPLLLVMTLVPLRLLKGLLIALQYRHDAGEGQIDRGDPA